MKSNIKNLLIITMTIFGILIMVFLYWHIQPYNKKYDYIAHALGGIDGVEYTNSKEALEHSYSMGFRLLEVDLLYTSDNHLVCRHNWNNDLGDGFSKNNIPDYKTFMSSKINGVYSTLDIESLIQFAMENPDVYFIIDFKPRKIDICEALDEIKDTAKKLGYTDLDRQFIIQFFKYEDYTRIKEKFSFDNYIFSLYRMKTELSENGIDNILPFCVENDIKVVTLSKKYITKEMCRKLKENNISVYIYTVDSRKTWLKLKVMGVDGIYTNNIYPIKIYCLILLFIGFVFIFSLLIIKFFLIKKIKFFRLVYCKLNTRTNVCNNDNEVI